MKLSTVDLFVKDTGDKTTGQPNKGLNAMTHNTMDGITTNLNAADFNHAPACLDTTNLDIEDTNDVQPYKG